MPVFAVLVVCEGNQCRSPVAEHVLRQALDRRQFEVLSAGTRAVEGKPVHPLTAAALLSAGLAVPSHSSTRVSGAAVAAADLILTAARAQRTAVAGLAAGAAGRTFTLLEFATLGVEVLTSEPGVPAEELVVAVAGRRSASWNDPRYDLPDPITGDAALHAVVLAQVVQASRTIAHLLTAN